MDGDRLMMSRTGLGVIYSTRARAKLEDSHFPTVAAVAFLSEHTWVMDGELMPGGEFVAFDILELDGQDLRAVANGARREILMAVSPFRVVKRAIGEDAKRELWDGIRQRGGEGVVFKLISAPYFDGRSEDAQRAKFYETEDFTVSAVNLEKCSVEVQRNGQSFGSVRSSFHHLPLEGDTVRVRYDSVTAKGKLLRAKIVRR